MFQLFSTIFDHLCAHLGIVWRLVLFEHLDRGLHFPPRELLYLRLYSMRPHALLTIRIPIQSRIKISKSISDFLSFMHFTPSFWHHARNQFFFPLGFDPADRFEVFVPIYDSTNLASPLKPLHLANLFPDFLRLLTPHSLLRAWCVFPFIQQHPQPFWGRLGCVFCCRLPTCCHGLVNSHLNFVTR